MSEQPSTPPPVGARRAPVVRAATFATVKHGVTPAPWLAGVNAHVRPLFPTDDEGETSGSEVQSGASNKPGASQGPAAPSLPPPAAEPRAAISQLPPTTENHPAAARVRDPHADAFARAVAEHLTARTRALVAVEEQLLELAVQLAEVLVEREIARDPEIHGVLARAALAALEGNQSGVVRASRAAYTAIVDAFGDPQVEVDGTQVRIVLDPRLEGLGVVVEGPESRVDGRVGERLRSALRAMQDERRRREAEVAT